MALPFLPRTESATFGLCCVGLEWQTEQSLKGLLSMLGEKAPGHWHCVDDVAQADLVLYEPGNVLAQALLRRAGQDRLFVPCTSKPGDDPLALRIPIGPTRLVAVLEHAIRRLKGSAPDPVERTSLCQALDDALQTRHLAGVAMSSSGEVGFLSPQHRGLYWPRKLDTDELAAILLDGARVRAFGEQDRALVDSLREVTPQMLTWDGVLWAIGVSKSSGRLLARLNPRTHYRLTRWPDFGLIGRRSTDIRCTALLTQKAFSPNALGALTSIPEARVFGFYNAAALCGILKPDVAATSLAEMPMPAGTLPETSFVGGMLRRLRAALVLGDREA